MCIGDCYILKEAWTVFWQKLPTEREFGNFVDHYAVAVKKIPVLMLPQDLKTCSEMILLAT